MHIKRVWIHINSYKFISMQGLRASDWGVALPQAYDWGGGACPGLLTKKATGAPPQCCRC